MLMRLASYLYAFLPPTHLHLHERLIRKSSRTIAAAMLTAHLSRRLRRIRRSLFFLALTCTLGGLQVVFSIVLAMVSPYLLTLGFSKSLVALVWLAGPIMGVVIQPYFGLWSDNCQVTWGRRRPFILGGAIGIVTSLIALAWTRDLVYFAGWMIQGSVHSEGFQTIVLIAAAFLLWVLIFAVQPLQAAIRALIVDSCSTEEMIEANAWASRMVGMGSLLSYTIQFQDMSAWLSAVDNAQMKVLCLITSAVLAVTVLICCVCVPEQDPSLYKRDEPASNVLRRIMEVCRSISKMSPQVRGICEVQFCSWFGWYCFMFCATTYIGEICTDCPIDWIETSLRLIYTRPTKRGRHSNGKPYCNTRSFSKGCGAQGLPSLFHLLDHKYSYHYCSAVRIRAPPEHLISVLPEVFWFLIPLR